MSSAIKRTKGQLSELSATSPVPVLQYFCLTILEEAQIDTVTIVAELNSSKSKLHSGDCTASSQEVDEAHYCLDEMMCDSLVIPSARTGSDSPSKCSHSGASYCSSEFQFDVLNDFHHDNSSVEVNNISEDTGSIVPCVQRKNAALWRIQLEHDVQQLQKQLQEEIELHKFLKNVIERNAINLSGPAHLPHHVQNLLSNIAVLETTVSKLEHETLSLRFQLSQERNEWRLAEYQLRHSHSPSVSCSSDIMNTLISSSWRSSKQFDCEGHFSGSSSCQVLDPSVECTYKSGELVMEPADFRKLPKRMPPKGIWDEPNFLSEEMVRCMKDIFMSLADSDLSTKSSAVLSQSSGQSPNGHLHSSFWWSSSERSTTSSWFKSPPVHIKDCEVLASGNACDPYRVRGKLSWADIGNYGLAIEVSWMSVGKKQLEYAAGALRKFRILVEQLAKVNPIHLCCSEKLAFWINLYNALIMHAYLAYGVPKSDLKMFSLLQKAAYTVGGHSFSAAAIEYVILRMKPPLHRPQIALLLAIHKLKVSEEQKKYAIDNYEPLVTFALSCGMYSSPAVRIYTPKNIREELEDAQRDFIRAAVGVSSRGRLLVPKMLHCFAKGFVDDANLAVWISHYLPPPQAAFVEQCISQRRQSILGSRNCGILPFDSRFRYLFLPHK
ncbi:Ternary complex factor MIP1, leucine-zipper [Sesbania bispinosa]|nr:Ternary complex factor MIP1, leucine-zipper [Sesbania bispinosa]